MALKRKKFLSILYLVLFVVTVGGLGAFRLGRHSSEKPVAVKPGIFRVRNLFTDLYGARIGDQAVLFDAGVDEAGAALDVLLGALSVARDQVEHVFLTHGHFDHVAAAPLCTRAKIHVGAPDVELMAHRVRAEPLMPRMMGHIFAVPAIESNAPFGGPTAIPLANGKELFATPLPGHTPGSYLLVYDGVMFAGDALQIDGDKLDFAISLFSSDMDADRRGVAGLKNALGGRVIDTVCTGHQGCTPAGKGGAMLDDLIARAVAAQH